MNEIALSPSLSSHLSITDSETIFFLDWDSVIVFNTKSNIPQIIILDLLQPRSLDILCGLREVLDSDTLPVYGFLSSYDIHLRNTFLACGGTGILEDLTSLPEPLEERNLGDINFPLRIGLSKKETVRRLLNNLEKQSVKRDLISISGETEVLSKTIEHLLENINKLLKIHISVILINNNQTVESYVRPERGVLHEDYKDFLTFCLNDFFTHFKGINMENPIETFFIDDAAAFNKIKIGNRKLSSYYYLPLKNSKEEIIGTIHFGHLSNNYFQGIIPLLVDELVKRLEPPLFLALKTSQNIVKQNKIFSIFSKFVPPEIIPDLIAQEMSRKKVAVQKKNITILFSDIRSFTTITEENNAQQVVNFLNKHFNTMVSVIKKHGGIIDKFIGDAIVAIFGLNDDTDNVNLEAVSAAIGMINKLDEVDCSGLVLPAMGYKIGIGLHHSEAIIGNIGSPDKSSFTAIGDVVGIAEELEGTTKAYKKPILVSKQVFDD
ncbi:MAG: adenylate/guanylate cyclase domain-containing protein, partial [Spirochaetales bacterium]|nr:adenylate/guanylate cyclase domain-containing protein [Spirochaetales bacterium]